jgi:hypothetical protein
MKKITAYLSRDGSIHQTKERAAAFDLLHELNNGIDGRGAVINITACERIVDYYVTVMGILREIDAPGAAE